ncbi:sulfurtransferase [Seohaeicola saemankumensis]|nr:sulfurtransferase [Seohaeicola saemankumensis]MCA0872589.1 sulfurtransferase [Seohaeicola saemankumensis]
MAQFRNPDALVSTDWLAQHLDDLDLRLFDCTTYLEFDDTGDSPYRVVSGRANYDAGHIPGAGYLDLQADLSMPDSRYRFTLPTPDRAARAFARAGVGDGMHVVLYSCTTMPWATRIWWMLRWLGFDNVSVLDGGYQKWIAEGRPTTTVPGGYQPAIYLTPTPRPEVFVTSANVLAGIGQSAICTINALGRDLYAGENTRYGRPGRVPGSVNVPALELTDPDTHELLPPDRLAQIFADVGADPDKQHITYCGGGIFATLDAFVLHQLGHDRVAVYDNSMSEWATQPALPMETD